MNTQGMPTNVVKSVNEIARELWKNAIWEGENAEA
jgi:hypothetical protein